MLSKFNINGIKRLLVSALAIALALVLSFGAPLHVFAASSSYVSEVVTYCANSYEEAKEGLESLGYQIVENSNLNSTLTTGVYLGYKTTTNKDEAITDLAVMNMNGPYSYSDYETILNNQRDEIMAKLDELMPAIAAFQDSYNEGLVSGKMVYATLNQYYEDDTNKAMGDIFLEYDFSDAKKAELTEILLQGSSAIILNMIETLALTAGYSDGECILDYMAELGLDGVYSQYYKDNKRNAAKAISAMNADLSARVLAIQNEWDTLYSTLCEVENSYIEFDGDELTVNLPDVLDAASSVEVATRIEEIDLYLMLKDVIIDSESGMSALEYFKRPFDNANLSDLYLFAYCLTDAQAGLLSYVSLAKLLALDTNGLDNGSSEAEACLDEYEVYDSYISVYEGIDRSYFEEGVAFTSEATKHESLTGDTWSAEATSFNWLAATIATSALTIACAGVGTGVLAYANKVVNPSQYLPKIAAAKTSLENARAEMQAAKSTYLEAKALELAKHNEITDLIRVGTMPSKQLHAEYRVLSINLQNAEKSYAAVTGKAFASNAELKELEANYAKGIGKGFKAVAGVMFALAIVFLIVDIVSIIMYFTSDEPEEANIPVHLVTALEDGDGKTDYVYYNTVNNPEGDVQDLNNHEGSKSTGWLVMYYTKDPLAGDPITADNLKVQVGSTDVSEDSYGIHMFNESAPANFTAEKYTSVADSVNGTYVLFERADSLAVGSAISQGFTFIFLAAGLVVGVVIGAIAAKISGKKKKMQQSA